MAQELQRVHFLLRKLQSDLARVHEANERLMKANEMLTRRVEQLEDDIPLSTRMEMFDIDP